MHRTRLLFLLSLLVASASAHLEARPRSFLTQVERRAAPTSHLLAARQGGGLLSDIFGGASSTDSGDSSTSTSATSASTSTSSDSDAASSSSAAADSSKASDAAASSSREAASSSSRQSASSASSVSASRASISSSAANTPTISTSIDSAGSTQIVTHTVPGSSASESASASSSSDGDSGSSNHTPLIIGVSVVGGVAILGALIFLYMKFGGRRFSDFKDDDADIKWPELKADGDAAAMQPLPARRTGGAGFDMGGESDIGHEGGDNHSMTEYGAKGRDSFTGSSVALTGAGAYQNAPSGYYDPYGGYGSTSDPAQAGYGGYGHQDMYPQPPDAYHTSPPMQPYHVQGNQGTTPHYM